MLHDTPNSTASDRARWMALLARASTADLETVWASEQPPPAYRTLRGPETGLVMLRGRMGGTGAPFNLGEASVSRCTVALEAGPVGHAYVLGRDGRHAELAAVYDALMQLPDRMERIRELLLEPVAAALAVAREARAREREATRVEFFTMVRGDG